MSSQINIRPFQSGDETAFRELNEQWIKKHFKLEGPDVEALGDPVKHIIEPGGQIFFATDNGRVVGCCALIADGHHSFELAKMAVDESCRGRGIGRKLIEEAIAHAENVGARLVHLESNRTLLDAVHLYESIGFRHISPERLRPSPYQRADVFMELSLPRGV